MKAFLGRLNNNVVPSEPGKNKEKGDVPRNNNEEHFLKFLFLFACLLFSHYSVIEDKMRIWV